MICTFLTVVGSDCWKAFAWFQVSWGPDSVHRLSSTWVFAGNRLVSLYSSKKKRGLVALCLYTTMSLSSTYAFKKKKKNHLDINSDLFVYLLFCWQLVILSIIFFLVTPLAKFNSLTNFMPWIPTKTVNLVHQFKDKPREKCMATYYFLWKSSTNLILIC